MYNSYFSQVNIITHFYFLICKKKRCAKAKCHNNNNNNNNLFLIRCKLTSEYDQMRLTTITACNNYNKVYLRAPKNL